jgi:hypothetical protein
MPRQRKARHTMTTLIAIEFPDYDVTTLPTMPVGFVDSSWHNDACPSFTKGDLTVFVDYADSAMRECGPDAPRFVLVRHTSDGDVTTLATTDVWARLLGAIEAAEVAL